jgi:hypothetical protein
MKFKQFCKKLLLARGYAVVPAETQPFHSVHYLRHNSRRLEHLASLSVVVIGKTVLEVGAGIGDHSHYYLDRGCQLTITEARLESLHYLQKRYPDTEIRQLNLDDPDPNFDRKFQVIHCYGVLYHLKNPGAALRYLAQRTTELLILETCVSFGSDARENLVPEEQSNRTQSITGLGCRPTRNWVFGELKKHFEHVYCTRTQPNHPEFPTDWTKPDLHHESLSRAVFVASRQSLDNQQLVDFLPEQQPRHA